MLAAAGREVLVLEREPADRLAIGAGILLQPNGLAVFMAWGSGDALLRDSVLYRAAASTTTGEKSSRTRAFLTSGGPRPCPGAPAWDVARHVGVGPSECQRRGAPRL
jgi:2-polyprenyl-6-methoxyphenol hydroxylase-like FAD-dependent oxidoreductase